MVETETGQRFQYYQKRNDMPNATKGRMPQDHLLAHFSTKSHIHPLLPQTASVFLSPHSSLVSQKNM